MDQQEFLVHAVGTAPGLLCIGKVGAGGAMERKYIPFPLAAPLTDEEWPYYIPAVFRTPGNDATTRCIAVDVDEEEQMFLFTPGLAASSSPARLQDYFLVTETIPYLEAKILGRRILPTADPSEFFRLPGLTNRKYANPFKVDIVRAPLTRYSVGIFRRLPDPNGTAIRNLPNYYWEPAEIGPREFARDLEKRFDRPKLGILIGNASTSFDDVLDMLLALDIPDEERIFLARNAASNPFQSVSGMEREVAKALLKRRTRRDLMDPMVRQVVDLRRAKKGAPFERRAKLSEYVMGELKRRGTMIHTVYDDCWYVDRESGRVTALTSRSEKLKNLITTRLGVNPVDQEHRHIRETIIAACDDLPPVGRVGDIAYYDPDAGTISIYLGGRDVLRLTTTGAELMRNGDENMMFNPPPLFEPLPMQMIDLESDYSGWWKEFFPGMPNVVGMTEAQASAMLRVWTTFILFQSAAASRPLLVFVGVYGSGKSTMLTCLLRLIYGVQAQLIKISGQQAFDTAMSNHILAFYDNVDTAQPWLNERLATAVSRVSDQKRKLYSDNDLYSVVNRAMLGISSRNAPFMQEDIIDRMMHFSLQRYEDLGIPLKFEGDLYANITSNRHRFMSGLIQDAWRVLKSPKPVVGAVQWRLADFVSMGVWIASTLGIEQEFRDGLKALKSGQRGLTIESDQALVDALETFAARCRTASNWRTASELWDDLLLYTTDDNAAAIRAKYKNATLMTRKLYSIHGVVRSIVPIEYEMDEERGFRKWHIKKEE